MEHSHKNQPLRPVLRTIFDAAVGAVAPDGAVLRHLSLKGDILTAGGRQYNLKGKKVTVLGGGKGAAPMAAAVEDLLGERINQGLVVVKYQHDLPLKHIQLMEASHPVPDMAGVAATSAMLDMARQKGEDDFVLCLFTGGASALTPAPAKGLELVHLQQTTQLLLQCGATIHEINALRKHLSVFSGGQLARALTQAEVLCLIVSDVIGDDLDVIASGPTAPDPSSFALCQDILHRYALQDRLPAPVREHLLRGLAGDVAETPKADDACFNKVHNVLVATNAQALEAAAHKAREQGYEPVILEKAMQGEAREEATSLVQQALALADTLTPTSRPLCLLAGGETTVTLKGKGRGGRNQEMALTAALALTGQTHIAALFAGTDGTDGPTDAAGGFAFATSAVAMREHTDPVAELAANNSYSALQYSGDLLITGPTRTNVMDMATLLIHHRV